MAEMSGCGIELSPAIGVLSAVDSLVFIPQTSTIILNWTAPFTLDITDVDPDITYRVNVIRSASSTTNFETNVTTLSFPLSRNIGCVDISFIVTPVNVLGEGSTSMITVNENGKYY